MKQVARIAKTRCYVLAELLYIQSSASRQRPLVIFCQGFCKSFFCLKATNNEKNRITHLSADKLSGLNCLSASHQRFVVIEFCVPTP